MPFCISHFTPSIYTDFTMLMHAACFSSRVTSATGAATTHSSIKKEQEVDGNISGRLIAMLVVMWSDGWKTRVYGSSGGSGMPVRWCCMAEMWAARCLVK